MPLKLKKELIYHLSQEKFSKKNLTIKNVKKISNKFIKKLKKKCKKQTKKRKQIKKHKKK